MAKPKVAALWCGGIMSATEARQMEMQEKAPREACRDTAQLMRHQALSLRPLHRACCMKCEVSRARHPIHRARINLVCAQGIQKSQGPLLLCTAASFAAHCKMLAELSHSASGLQIGARACLRGEHPEEGGPQGEVCQQRKHLGAAAQEGQQQEGLPAIGIAPAPHHWRLRRCILAGFSSCTTEPTHAEGS